ncbi:hypothetical protein L083_2271 [Actinoplanes sp. N902-109]|nr:hypothetical protein L083_2271 [Actinoplanes sp. N902-109]
MIVAPARSAMDRWVSGARPQERLSIALGSTRTTCDAQRPDIPPPVAAFVMTNIDLD